jgi:ABC-type Fe3+-siderophore transport system permease subunit
MKRILVNMGYRFLFVFVSSFILVVATAQDSSGSVKTTTTKSTTTTTTSDWYMQSWVWVVGGAVFLIILIALLRGNSRKDTEVTRNTTIVRDRDPKY